MAVADKIKALLKLQGKKTEDLAEALGLASKQALYNKFNRDSFTASDLIKAADFLNCDLNFETKEGQKITLTVDDIKKLLQFGRTQLPRKALQLQSCRVFSLSSLGDTIKEKGVFSWNGIMKKV